MCGSNVFLEIIESGIVDEIIAALVLVADHCAESGDTGFIGERQLSRVDLHGWGNRQASKIDGGPRTRGCV